MSNNIAVLSHFLSSFFSIKNFVPSVLQEGQEEVQDQDHQTSTARHAYGTMDTNERDGPGRTSISYKQDLTDDESSSEEEWMWRRIII